MPTFTETTDIAASTATNRSLAVGQSVQGQIGSAGDHDWIRVNVVSGQTYTFDVVATGATSHFDPNFYLRSSGGVLLEGQFNDDGGANTNSRLTFTAQTTGAIYVDVSAFSATETGQYQLLVSNTTRPAFELPMAVGTLDSGINWGVRGAGADVTFGFRATPASYLAPGSDIGTFTQVTTAEIAAVQRVLQLWSEVADINFTRVNPTGYTDNATILFSNYTDPTDAAGAFAYFPGLTASTENAGDVWLNTDSVSTSSLPTGSYSFFTILHEVGHALGLSHPGDYDASLNGNITFANSAQFTQDSQQYTVMSYFDASNTGADFGPGEGYPATPMLFDIAALQQLYGANTTTRTGATTYGYNNNAGISFDASNANSRVFTIWDAGGVDTLDFSGWSGNQTITLVAGEFSNTTGLTSNVAIAYGAVIENAIGGAGNDVLFGNAVANILNGGAGNDTMTGGLGGDTYFVDSASDQVIETSATDAPADLVNASINYTLGNNVENLTITGTATTADGNGIANVITGNANANLLNGWAGADTLIGGDGNDIYYLDNVGDTVVESNAVQATGGFDIAIATANATLSANVEQLVVRGGATQGTGNNDANIIYGLESGLALTLNGAGGDDVIYGSTFGFNILFGGAGVDTLLAYGGNNTLQGGLGNDIYYSYDGTNTISEVGGDGIDTVYATHSLTVGAGIEQVLLSGAATSATSTNATDNNIFYGNSANGAVTLSGGGGADVLFGGNFGDTLNGGDGVDLLFGFGGANTLVGGNDTDIYYLSSGLDVITETSTGGFDTIYSSAAGNTTIAQNVEQLILYSGATSATGNNGDNSLFGHINTVAVTLDGQGGNDYLLDSQFSGDVLIGGAGNDQLDLRSGGNDRLVFTTAGFGNDIVYGFDTDAAGGQDILDISGRGFTAGNIGGSILIAASGDDTLITIASDTIRLSGVNSATVNAASFQF